MNKLLFVKLEILKINKNRIRNKNSFKIKLVNK